MPVSIGLDFGSLGYRAAYVLEGEIISVPMPTDEAGNLIWRGLIFVDPDPDALPFGLTFTSLKYQLGTRKHFNWRGGSHLPEDAVRESFAKIKRAVETYAGEDLGRTVIAVPAQYPAMRRSILRELAEEAGLGEVDLINDCTAAALAHTYGQENAAQTLLLYSMGFIGFEVSLLRYASQRHRELVHEGARAPSGREFDLQAMAATISTVRQQGKDLPTKVFTNQWFEFRYLASDLKERLTMDSDAILELPSYLTGTETMRIRFRRESFERAISGQVEATLKTVRGSLEDSNMRPEDVDTVLLVGGSTRIGLIQRRLVELFGDKLVQPRDELIARGAAVQAHRLARQAAGEKREVFQPPPAMADEAGVTPSEGETKPVSMTPEPDTDLLFAYVQRLVELGQDETAIGFLEALEKRSRALREQLSQE